MSKVDIQADIPQEVNYVNCTVNVGTTETLPQGSDAAVTNSGTETHAILNFGIPRGTDGDDGKSAYQQAVDGGYEGTEEEFEQALASDIATVADNISDINAVGQSIADVNAVADTLSDVSVVANIATEVSTVSDISADVAQVSSISSAVSNVSNNDTAILLVSDNMASVSTTASSIGDVNTVAGIATDVSNVADNNTNITAVASDLTNIDTAATNIAAIIAAPTAATNAATSATNAQTWAEGTDSAITPLGGEHSAKGWANIAKQYAESIGSALKYKGSVSTYSALPATRQEIGDMWNVLDTGKNYAWTGTEWDDLAGVVDLSAYRTAAAQDTIDAGKQDKLPAGTSGNVLTYTGTAGSVGSATLATVATTGAYSDLSGTPTIPLVNNATLTITQGGSTKGTFTANASSDVTIALDDSMLPSQTGNAGKFLATNGTIASWSDVSIRNIGEIVQSTIPLTDAGLHLLDGALISGTGTYSAFVTYVAGLVSSYPDLFETEANWQTAVSAYGVCGKFVYDNVNNTVRLPKITGIIEGTTDTTALGNLLQAGLPDIGGTFSSVRRGGGEGASPTGAFAIQSNWNAANGAGGGDGWGSTYNFTASRSNSIYGNSSTVQPQTIKTLYYICIANAVKTAIEADIDQIATDLNMKANVSLDNLSSTGKSLAAGLGMPLMDSSHWVPLTLGASGTTYTMPEDGLVCFDATGGTVGGYILLTCGYFANIHLASQTYEVLRTFMFIPKGYNFSADYASAGTAQQFGYYKLKGNAN